MYLNNIKNFDAYYIMTLTYKINVFKELVEFYPTWNDLRSYLESEEGGLFRVIDTNDDYCMIRYEKGISKMDLPHSKWFRSVVWDIKTHRPVCIAPPKSSNGFDALNTELICQELLDGFMINCFKVDKTLHITSRSKLDAAGTFYSDRSFRDLFMEAYMNTKDCSYSEMIQEDIRPPRENELSVFYSFLVQHTEHRNVKKIDKNCVYVVHRGVVLKDGTVEFEDSPPLFKKIENIPFDKTNINEWIKNIMNTNDWQFQGIVFKDTMGNRLRFRSDKYAAVKALRGNTSNMCDRFAQLYSQNLLFKYLEYYQDEIVQMNFHVMFLNTIIKTLYDNYVNLHIKKTKTVEDIDKMFLPHLYSIHGLYLSELRPKKVTMNDIAIYLQKQPWQRISFLIKKLFSVMN